MGRESNLIVYNPTEEVTERVLENAELTAEWDVKKHTADNQTETVTEMLFSLSEPLYGNQDLRTWLVDTMVADDTGMIISESRPGEVSAWTRTADEQDELLSLDDITPETQDANRIIESECAGGDIRKYLTSGYGGCRFSVDFSVGGTKKVRQTSMNPLSMSGVHQLAYKGIAENTGPLSQEKILYPSARRLLLWSSSVQEQWDVECGALGAIHFKSDGTARAGFDGFVIYNATEEIKDWCDERWTKTSGGEVSPPFMQPDEYRLITCDESPENCSPMIRMWWD